MKVMYIARKYIAIEGGARHFYEEEIFDSYEFAYSFIKNISEEEDDAFLSEIVSCNLNGFSCKNRKEIFVFDRLGVLVWKNTPIEKIDPGDIYTGRFSLGDIVKVHPFPWNAASPTCVETIGVVGSVPAPFDEWMPSEDEEWVSSDGSKEQWDGTYIVYCVRNGYLAHWHILEEGMDIYREELPENLCFLKILANHFLKIKCLPEKVYKEIYEGKLFIEKVDHFMF